MARSPGARDRLRSYFLSHIGEVLDSETLREVGGISEWARRVRELREIEGFDILTDKHDSSLRPGQYLLKDPKPRPVFSQTISKETRAFVLDRNGFTCQMCGAAAGEPHPYDAGHKTRLHLGHIIDKSHGGTDDPSNLRAICSVCNEGLSNLSLERPSSSKLLAQIRRAPGSTQVEVLRWLSRKYPKQAAKFTEGDDS